MGRPRALLADDHVMLLDAFEKLLAAEVDVVGKVADGRALVAEAERLHPDIVVVDMMMPGLNGLDAARQLRKSQPHVGVVFLTIMEDAEVAAETVRLGACGYVLKRSAASELVTAIREVLQKRSYITPLMTGGIVDSLLHSHDAGERHVELTQRQREVLQLLAEGHSMKEVAGILDVTPRTVAFHKYRMMAQLQISSTAQLIQFAIRRHLVS